MHACMHAWRSFHYLTEKLYFCTYVFVPKTSDIIQKTKIGLLCEWRNISVPKISDIRQKTKIGLLCELKKIYIPKLSDIS